MSKSCVEKSIVNFRTNELAGCLFDDLLKGCLLDLYDECLLAGCLFRNLHDGCLLGYLLDRCLIDGCRLVTLTA